MENKAWNVMNVLRGYYSSSSYVEILSGVCFIEVIKEKYNIDFDYKHISFSKNDKNFTTFERDIVNQMQLLTLSSVDENILNDLLPIINGLTNRELADILVRISQQTEDSITPTSLIDLSLKLLKIKDDENILDLCSGYGLCLNEALKNNNSVEIYGKEINKVYSLISKIILYLLDANADIRTTDVLVDSVEPIHDKVFSHIPFIMRLDRHKIDLINGIKNKNFNYEFDIRVSSDWVFVSKVINSLKDTGKGIVIMMDGPLYKSQDEEFRQAIVNSGYIEAIIQLPERLLLNTPISISLLVLSKDVNRKKIKVIDASNIYTKGRRVNELLEENVTQIVKMYESNDYYICLKEIEGNDYMLSPKRYSNQVTIDNPIKVEEFAESIFRGVQISAKELDQSIVDDQTYDYKILNLSNINENVIDYKNLQKVKLDGKKWDKYLLEDKDFVISAKGSTIKTTVVEIGNNEKILASGNLMVIRINQEKVNPYYLKVFLDSSLGKKIINSVQTGSLVISIGKKNLENMEIPYVDLDLQNNIAAKYLAYKDELEYTMKKVKSLQKNIDNVYDDVIGGE